MCGIWNQTQWKDAANDKNSGYTLLGEYQNGKGERALMMRESYGYITNVYNDRGSDTQFFTRGDGETVGSRQQAILDRATRAMTERGFSPIVESARVPGIAELASTNVHHEAAVAIYGGQGANAEPTVQGKTIAEWKRIGEENEGTPDHVHPDFPEGYTPTELELEAYTASLTGAEAFMATLMLAGV